MFNTLINEVQAIEGIRPSEVYRNFVTSAFNAMRKTTELSRVKQDEYEEKYMQVVRSCRKPDKTMQAYKEMYWLIVDELEKGLNDVLGPVYMEHCASGRAGQFFTPWHVCLATAGLVVKKEDFDNKPFITVSEPASGTGAMVLALCHVLKQMGINYQERTYFELVDVDPVVFMSAYVQCALAGIPAKVICGNTLKLETYDFAYTPMVLIHRMDVLLGGLPRQAPALAPPRKRRGKHL